MMGPQKYTRRYSISVGLRQTQIIPRRYHFTSTSLGKVKSVGEDTDQQDLRRQPDNIVKLKMCKFYGSAIRQLCKRLNRIGLPILD